MYQTPKELRQHNDLNSEKENTNVQANWTV